MPIYPVNSAMHELNATGIVVVGMTDCLGPLNLDSRDYQMFARIKTESACVASGEVCFRE